MSPLDDDLDLDAMVADIEAEHTSNVIRQRAAREANRGTPAAHMVREAAKPDPEFQWITVAAVALFHTQVCASCGHKHRFFMGWMTAQRHRTDPNCRRLTRGMPPGTVERRIEEHAQPEAELCGDCAESSLLVMTLIDCCSPPAEGGRTPMATGAA